MNKQLKKFIAGSDPAQLEKMQADDYKDELDYIKMIASKKRTDLIQYPDGSAGQLNREVIIL